ncbi:MAG: hypothetical protein HQ575_06430 [Candidatus Omnitrophica bacterium]|nr:hypothetical protein [Candidatus Omnitrophota bacterium]
MQKILYVIILSAALITARYAYCEDPSTFEITDGFYPSGWMGDYGDVKVDLQCTLKPQEGSYCQKWTYNARRSQGSGWASVSWQYPENNWGDKKGRDLSRFGKLTFWARGEEGREVINVRIGGKGNSLNVGRGPISLTSEWEKYTIDLSPEDLSNVTSGFCWTASKAHNFSGCTFYLDAILYE